MVNAPSQLARLCESEQVTIHSLLVRKPIDRNAKGEDWKQSAYEFVCVLSFRDRTMQVPYWMGSGHETFFGEKPRQNDHSLWAEERRQRAIPPKPSAADVLSSLILDSSACDQTFDDWCGDFGMDTDSIKARDTYMECQRIGSEVRRLLGSYFPDFQKAEH